MRKPRLAQSAMLSLLLFAGCLSDPDREARGSVVENEVAGILYTDAGPAIGARVYLYNAGVAAGALAEAVTDDSGRYAFTGLAAGTYSVLGGKDGLLAFRDSVNLALSSAGKVRLLLPGDTLAVPGSIRVQVTLKPGDDPASVTGVVLGTSFSAHSDPAGDVSMGGMPPGRLRVRFTSSLPGYQPLVVSVAVASGRTTEAGVLALPSQ